jgi:hypothetical protein
MKCVDEIVLLKSSGSAINNHKYPLCISLNINTLMPVVSALQRYYNNIEGDMQGLVCCFILPISAEKLNL